MCMTQPLPTPMNGELEIHLFQRFGGAACQPNTELGNDIHDPINLQHRCGWQFWSLESEVDHIYHAEYGQECTCRVRWMKVRIILGPRLGRLVGSYARK